MADCERNVLDKSAGTPGQTSERRFYSLYPKIMRFYSLYPKIHWMFFLHSFMWAKSLLESARQSESLKWITKTNHFSKRFEVRSESNQFGPFLIHWFTRLHYCVYACVGVRVCEGWKLNKWHFSLYKLMGSVSACGNKLDWIKICEWMLSDRRPGCMPRTCSGTPMLQHRHIQW